LNYLDTLESESIYILREVAAQFEKPALLFSGGKDSICLVHLSLKAFRPGHFPFPLVHIDTEHNFKEAIDFRDALTKKTGEKLIVRSVEDSIKSGKAIDPTGPGASRNSIQSITLLDTIAEFKFDALIGGARRDEEKARAKQRIFSFRDEFGQWDPRNQRPELWKLYNGKLKPGENMRVFPLSNWTELDVWNYIKKEKIEIPKLYFSHQRKCILKKNGTILAECPFIQPEKDDVVKTMTVRCRTVGDLTCTGLIESTAKTIDEVIEEVIQSKTTERGTRSDDKACEAAMEDRKKQGYF